MKKSLVLVVAILMVSTLAKAQDSIRVYSRAEEIKIRTEFTMNMLKLSEGGFQSVPIRYYPATNPIRPVQIQSYRYFPYQRYMPLQPYLRPPYNPRMYIGGTPVDYIQRTRHGYNR